MYVKSRVNSQYVYTLNSFTECRIDIDSLIQEDDFIVNYFKQLIGGPDEGLYAAVKIIFGGLHDVPSLMNLQASPYPIDQASIASFQQYGSLHRIFHNPETYLGKQSNASYACQDYVYTVYHMEESAYKGEPVVVEQRITIPELLRLSGTGLFLRYKLQLMLLNLIQQRIQYTGQLFYGLSEQRISSLMEETKALQASISLSSLGDYHGQYKDNIGYSNFIYAQLSPLLKLIYGNACWDVTKHTRSIGILTHYLYLYSGYYTHAYIDSFLCKYDEQVLQGSVGYYTNLLNEQDAVYSFQKLWSLMKLPILFLLLIIGYMWSMLVVMGFGPIEACIILSEPVNILLRGILILGATVLYTMDFNEQIIGTSFINIIISSVLFSMKRASLYYVNLVCICSKIITVPTDLLRKLILYPVVGSWLYKQNQDSKLNNSYIYQVLQNTLHYGGWLDLSITFLESMLLLYLSVHYFCYTALSFCFIQSLSLLHVVLTIWSNLIYMKSLQHIRSIHACIDQSLKDDTLSMNSLYINGQRIRSSIQMTPNTIVIRSLLSPTSSNYY